jgi:hypothetical protein
MMLLALSLVLAMQAETPAPAPAPVTQQALDAMSDACHTPRKWLKLLGGDEVQFLPPPHARFKQVDCLLAHLRSSNVPMKLGFVGNEVAQ